MSSIISGTSGFLPALAKIPLPLDKSVGNVKDAANFNAMEIQGYVTVVAGSTYRASVKVSVVKNGAGTYEVVATDIAGDDISGSPIVSFSMSGSMLQAQVSSSFGTVTNAEISFSVLNPSLNGERESSVDASAIVSGTIDSDRLPAGQYPGVDGSSAVSAGYVGQIISGRQLDVGYTEIALQQAHTENITLGNGSFIVFFQVEVGRGASFDRGLLLRVFLDGATFLYNLGGNGPYGSGEILASVDVGQHHSLSGSFPVRVTPGNAGVLGIQAINQSGNPGSMYVAFRLEAVRIA